MKTSVKRWMVRLAPMALAGLYIALAWSALMAMAFEALGLLSSVLASLVMRGERRGRLACGALTVTTLGLVAFAVERAEYEFAAVVSAVPFGCCVGWLGAAKSTSGQLRRELWMLVAVAGGIVAVNLDERVGLRVAVVLIAVGGGVLLSRSLRSSHHETHR